MQDGIRRLKKHLKALSVPPAMMTPIVVVLSVLSAALLALGAISLVRQVLEQRRKRQSEARAQA